MIAINPEGGKVARAWSISPDAEADNVDLPDEPWAEEVILEAAMFPNALYDDDVDGTRRRFALVISSLSSSTGGAVCNPF